MLPASKQTYSFSLHLLPINPNILCSHPPASVMFLPEAVKLPSKASLYETSTAKLPADHSHVDW